MNQHTEPTQHAADAQLDQMLGSESELLPTSGFLAAVMERVQEEAAAPAPITFPWKRILPAAVVAGGVALWFVVATLRFLVPALVEGLRSSTTPGASPIHISSSMSGLMLACGAALLSWVIVSRVLRRSY